MAIAPYKRRKRFSHLFVRLLLVFQQRDQNPGNKFLFNIRLRCTGVISDIKRSLTTPTF